MRKPFTVEQANALIPQLERALAHIRAGRDAIRERMDKLQVLDALWGAKVTSPGNPDHGEYLEHKGHIERAAAAIENVVMEKIVARGLRFPAGGLEHGLIDFPTTFEGRWIYLCWRSSEPCVLAWHELDGGFAGRQALTPEQASRMGRDDDPALHDDSALDI